MNQRSNMGSQVQGDENAAPLSSGQDDQTPPPPCNPGDPDCPTTPPPCNPEIQIVPYSNSM